MAGVEFVSQEDPGNASRVSLAFIFLLLRRRRWDIVDQAPKWDTKSIEVALLVAPILRAVAVYNLRIKGETEVSCSQRPKARRETSELKDSPSPPKDGLVPSLNVGIRLMNPWSRLTMGKAKVAKRLA